jgi:hypothetical protein
LTDVDDGIVGESRRYDSPSMADAWRTGTVGVSEFLDAILSDIVSELARLRTNGDPGIGNDWTMTQRSVVNRHESSTAIIHLFP